MPGSPSFRRVRIVCISDTHNSLPKLPSGDVLIHAGDLTNQGSYTELSKSVEWLDRADFKFKIVVAGNHDITLDKDFYGDHGHCFHNQQRLDPRSCRDLLAKARSLTYLEHESKRCRIENEDGTITSLNIFGSPYSPSRGLWAFGYAPEDGAEKWANIPLDTDIVVTHTPPKFHCDESPSKGSAGCEELRRALWRVRPRLAVCGHIHEARGVESVLWDLDARNVEYKELETFYWNDATGSSKKQFKVDLTRRSVRPLQNDGAEHNLDPSPRIGQDQGSDDVTLDQPHVEYRERSGIGGLPAILGHCDFEALAGREGRKETCIVNASLTGSSWPHSAGKKLNKPVMIDLELPTIDPRRAIQLNG
jgi:Icc-related predicted phosphoesterase